jgi:hypothetical protein
VNEHLVFKIFELGISSSVSGEMNPKLEVENLNPNQRPVSELRETSYLPYKKRETSYRTDSARATRH